MNLFKKIELCFVKLTDDIHTHLVTDDRKFCFTDVFVYANKHGDDSLHLTQLTTI